MNKQFALNNINGIINDIFVLMYNFYLYLLDLDLALHLR